jgi:hypothetical protein
MANRYTYLDLDSSQLHEKNGISITVKLDDEGLVIDVWGSDTDEPIATTYQLYSEMGLDVKESD